MDKDFTPYEIALALKELGFDEPCLGFYKSDKLEFQDFISQNKKRTNSWYTSLNGCTAPTFSQAFRFFRERYGIFSSIWVFETEQKFFIEFGFGIQKFEVSNKEEAELECLKKLIEIVKQW